MELILALLTKKGSTYRYIQSYSITLQLYILPVSLHAHDKRHDLYTAESFLTRWKFQNKTFCSP